MLKFLLKDYDTKEARYVVVVVHDSGLALEVGIGLKDSVSEIIRVLNQASVALEANTVNMFYSVGKTLEQAKQVEEKKSNLIIEGKAERLPAEKEVRDRAGPVQSDDKGPEGTVRTVPQATEESQPGPQS